MLYLVPVVISPFMQIVCTTTLSVYNGFHYPKTPQHLTKIYFITERLISPQIPFMDIRRLRHVQGQFGIYGQIINVPVAVDTMV